MESDRAIAILDFIKEKEIEGDQVRITKDKVAKYMNEKGICSRPTTLNLLTFFLEEGILLEKQRRNKYAHNLVVNKDFDYQGLFEELILYYFNYMEESLKPFESLIKNKKIKYKIDKKSKGELIAWIQMFNQALDKH